MPVTISGDSGITTPDLTDTSLTSGRVVYAGASGNLTGTSTFVFDGSNLGIGVASSSQTLYINKAVSGNYGAIALIGNSAGAAADRSGIYGSFNGDYRGGITFWPGSNGAVSIHTGNNAAPTTGQTAFFASNLTAQFAASISVGNATPSASGAGITFPATQSASSDANTLDDYEEGTWTPTLNFAGGTTGITYASVRFGRYTKVGRIVTVGFCIILSSKGSSTGNANISGLPFPAFNNSGFNPAYAGTLVGEDGMSSMPTGTYCLAWSDSSLYLRSNGAVSFSPLTNTNFTNTSTIYGTITYEVT
jgi:hypothetical protein